MRKAYKPEEVADLFIEAVNAGDLDGVVSVFEEDAVVAGLGGHPPVRGREAIRSLFAGILAGRPRFAGVVQSPAIVHGDLALTSARLPNGFVTTEVARRQPDGSWLWVIDQPMAADLSAAGDAAV